MGLEVNFFVHGVSRGHKTWGADDADSKYANSFYSGNWPLREMMMVEVRENGGTPCCYYSFIRGEKVLGADKRDGSYFALTLRMNACYTDLQNMYHILRAAYEKVCVGLCIEEREAFAQFTTDDFQDVSKGFKNLKDSIIYYIQHFSRGEDIAPLNGFMRGTGKIGAEANSSECNRSDVLAALKRTGKVLVSHLYPTTSEAAIQSAANQKIAQCQADMQRNIQAMQSQTAQSIAAAKEQCAREKKELQDKLENERKNAGLIAQNMRTECDKKIADIKAGYAKFDQKERELNEAINQKKKTIKEKDDQIANKDKEIKRLKKQLEAYGQQDSDAQADGTQKDWAANVTIWQRLLHYCEKGYALINAGVLLLLIIIIILLLANCNQLGRIENAVCPDPLATSADTTATASTDALDGEDTLIPLTQEQADSLKELYDFRIDIEELSGNQEDLKVGKPYTLALKAKNKKTPNVPLTAIFTQQQMGEFRSATGIDINDSTITASSECTDTLTYVVGDVVIASREIKVKK